MIVTGLRLRGFRNYGSCEVEFHPGINLIVGANAQGKTNLIESLVCLSLTKSHRLKNDQKLIMEGADHADIACVCVNGKKKRLRMVIHKDGKALMYDRQPVKRMSDFIGLLNVVLFSPDDLSLFNDAPRERRRVMDQEIGKINSSYLHAVSRYQNFLKEKNNLLKTPVPDETYLDILDERMIEEEITILKERKQFIASLNETVPGIYRELSQEEDRISIGYETYVSFEDDLKEELVRIHRNNRVRDLEYRMSINGVHRDDMRFLMNEQSIPDIASQGQKRMTVLAFKMALAEYIKTHTGESPVLLLDDVLSELDRHHQERLISKVRTAEQCFITAAEMPETIKGLEPSVYEVVNGTVRQTGGSYE
ncbi:MAG: DNA replication/repair protein RecF [Solobacterium sp.]|nr:DNA replication/repair protein RecF [Solobacterium sp.]